MYGLNGRVGLVTGAGGGIGREIARRLAREGIAVAVLDRDGAAAQAAAAEVSGLAVTGDVTSPEEMGRAVDAVLGRFRQIDVLVNNAGVAWMGPALEMPLEALQSMLRVNVEGVFIVSRAVLPHMIARRSGSVVNLASWAGKTGNAFFAGYSASKFAGDRLDPGIGARDGAASRPGQRDLPGDCCRHGDAERDRGATAPLRAPRNRRAREVDPIGARFGAR
jgi:NAD(P)-dependent dehydrogenase (short-subunit alcohol dehydrogenase family)